MVKNLIFDLGGVILDLDVPRTITELSKLTWIEPAKVTEIFRLSPGFLEFEKGLMQEGEFRRFVRSTFDIKATDEEIDSCWNAMLLTIPPARLDLLTILKEKYKTFLLSNTNTIHLDYINNKILPAMDGVVTLDDYFHKTYYSHLMKKRKPEAKIFLQVLEENGLEASETLFLDDNADNIEGAKKVGLKTAFVNTNNFILDYFHEYRTA
jgi:glucose-1-phosphatase